MNGRRERAIPVTPDQIERRGFGIEPRGYDRHEVREFLYQVADALRTALQATGAPTYGPGEATTRGPLGPQVGADPYDDVPNETARILRAAYQSATQRRDDPPADPAIVERARHEAHEMLRRAHAEAEQQRDEARRVLLAAQEQAVDVVADAEGRARELLISAREDGRRQLETLADALEARSYQVEETERSTLQRLAAARAELSEAIEMLLGERAAVAEEAGPAATAPGDRSDGSDRSEDDEPPEEVVAELIRVAVARAAESGAGWSEETDDPEPGDGDAADRAGAAVADGDDEPPTAGWATGTGAVPPDTPAAEEPYAGDRHETIDLTAEDADPGNGVPPSMGDESPGITPWTGTTEADVPVRLAPTAVAGAGGADPDTRAAWPRHVGVEVVLHHPMPEPWAPSAALPRLLRPGVT
jgi:DivIVA domain-containing protein